MKRQLTEASTMDAQSGAIVHDPASIWKRPYGHRYGTRHLTVAHGDTNCRSIASTVRAQNAKKDVSRLKWRVTKPVFAVKVMSDRRK